MNQNIIGVMIDGTETWHVVGSASGDYATLCGLDGHDDHKDVGQSGTIEPRRGQKIDCPQCRDIWRHVTTSRLRKSNFRDLG